MDRDEIVAILVVPVVAIAFWLSGRLFPSKKGGLSEGEAWRALWLPAIAPLLAIATLAGATLADPEAPHAITIERSLIALPSLMLIARVVSRAARALRPTNAHAYARGLIKPQVAISDTLREVLTADELHAVVLHEEAHVRHFDPLRILIARAATDLQWPFDSAEKRYTAWANALEFERDRNACARGADPLALASSLVKAAHLQGNHSAHRAALVDGHQMLEARVNALLEVRPALKAPPRSRRITYLATLSVIAMAFALGFFNGGEIVTLLAGE